MHDPETGEEITAANGRYGPYVKRGSESRSLQVEEELFSITLERALVVLALDAGTARVVAGAASRSLLSAAVVG